MMTVDQAAAELEEALAPPQEDLRRRILGLVLASEAGLSTADLRELTRTPTVAATLRSSFGRVLRELPTSNEFGWIAQRAYVFSHDALRQQAHDHLAHDLPQRRREIRAWSDAYRQPLPADGDPAALLAAAVDPERHDRMLNLLGDDDTAWREVVAASDVLGEVTTSLTTICRIAIEYERLTERASSIPTRLPAVWVRLGQTEHAIRSVSAIQHAELREEAEHATTRAFAGEDILDLGKRYVRTISAEQDVENLADAVVTLAAIGNHVRALDLVRELRRTIRRAWMT